MEKWGVGGVCYFLATPRKGGPKIPSASSARRARGRRANFLLASNTLARRAQAESADLLQLKFLRATAYTAVRGPAPRASAIVFGGAPRLHGTGTMCHVAERAVPCAGREWGRQAAMN